MSEMSNQATHGTCALCGKRLTRAGMTRHLQSCLPKHEPATPGKTAKFFHLRVEEAWSPPFYWMNIEMPASATLAELDGFLRQHWLECCGHLSEFTIDGDSYTVTGPDMFGSLFGGEQRDMDVKLDKVLHEGSKFDHVYDFGSSTQLKLRVAGERKSHIGSAPLRVLSQNEAPEWACAECGEPATQVCTDCMYETENPFYCEAHARNHGCGEDFLLPVVNSPRMGVCGYTGPDELPGLAADFK